MRYASYVSQHICSVGVDDVLFSFSTLRVPFFLHHRMPAEYLIDLSMYQTFLALKATDELPYIRVQTITISAKTSMPSFNVIVRSRQFIPSSSMHIPNEVFPFVAVRCTCLQNSRRLHQCRCRSYNGSLFRFRHHKTPEARPPLAQTPKTLSFASISQIRRRLTRFVEFFSIYSVTDGRNNLDVHTHEYVARTVHCSLFIIEQFICWNMSIEVSLDFAENLIINWHSFVFGSNA